MALEVFWRVSDIEFEFLIKNMDVHMHTDIELFYVMEGQIDFTLEESNISGEGGFSDCQCR